MSIVYKPPSLGYSVTAARMEKVPGNIKEHGVFRRREILLCG